MTSRSENAAFRLIGSHHDIIKVEPTDQDGALLLFGRKLLGGFEKDDATQLLKALDYMPLAINQAAAYVSQRPPRTTVDRSLDDFRKSDRNRASSSMGMQEIFAGIVRRRAPLSLCGRNRSGMLVDRLP